MSITLGSNIASLRAQRQLSRTSSELGTVFERLSSGQRINNASDDAAGLAIADSLKADALILNQGVRNLNDGLSLLSIADAAIENLSGIVVRLEELAAQAANGIYGKEQRKAIDAEAQALSDEFFRISKTTEFNGQKLFTGENPNIALQAGVGNNAIIDASVGGAIGTGNFLSKNSFGVGVAPLSVTTGDFNGDGNLDLITADASGDSARVLLGLGNGSFSTGTSIEAGDLVASVSTGDFNGDGVLDFVSADYNDDTISIFLGHGNGTFSARVSYVAGDAPRSVDTADFNGDGILDLVTADKTDDTVSVLLGLGDGIFAAKTSYTAGEQASSVTTGDFNGDGIVDLATAEYIDSTISVFLGLGNGTFSARTSYAAGSGAFSVNSGDFNADGVLDFVTADTGDDTISVLLGLGDGTFSARTSYVAGDEPQSVSTADFNGDGVLDIVSTERNDNSVSVFLGVGDGSFSARTSFSVGVLPRSVNTGDFNGDGVADIVTADTTDSTVSILLAETKAGVAPLLPFSLETLADARQALPIFQNKREQLAEQRGEIGANQARIEVATNVLTVASENFKAAESQIRDADIAAEAANLTRLQILQQASSAILAQANEQPALALLLLR